MELEVDYILWDSEHKKIEKFKTLKITESDIIEMLQNKYDNNELPIPINLNKDELKVEFSVRGGSF
jgi:hypothetical protein